MTVPLSTPVCQPFRNLLAEYQFAPTIHTRERPTSEATVADYIHTNILSQAYIHVEGSEITEEDLPEIEEQLAGFAASRAKFFLYPEVLVRVELEDGSVKARVTVMGTIFLLMQGVANYPDFREGVGLIYQDAKQLAEYVVSEAQFLLRSKHGDVIHTEARTGILTSLQKIMSQLESIKRGTKDGATAHSLARQIAEVHEEIEKLMHNLANEDDREIVRDGLSGAVLGLPRVPGKPKKGHNSREAIDAYIESRKKLTKLLRRGETHDPSA